MAIVPGRFLLGLLLTYSCLSLLCRHAHLMAKLGCPMMISLLWIGRLRIYGCRYLGVCRSLSDGPIHYWRARAGVRRTRVCGFRVGVAVTVTVTVTVPGTVVGTVTVTPRVVVMFTNNVTVGATVKEMNQT